MSQIVFEAKIRKVVGKQVKALRREGRIPAVLYGRSIAPINVTLDAKTSNRILPGVSASQLVVIDVEGERHSALVREKQFNKILGTVLHVDFNVVSMTEKLRTTVNLHLDGESPAVKDLDGILVMAINVIEIECLPGNLPERIQVDVSVLKQIGDSIHVRDLVMPADVEVLTDSDEMVVVVTAPEAEEVAEPVVAEPEVIEKGKKEEEE